MTTYFCSYTFYYLLIYQNTFGSLITFCQHIHPWTSFVCLLIISFVPQLEIEEPSLKLCLQHRDLPNTSSIADTFPGVSQLCAKHVLIVSRSYLETEWIQIKFALQELHKKIKFRPIIVLLEELSSLDLAAAPEFNLLLKAATVLNYWEINFNQTKWDIVSLTHQNYGIEDTKRHIVEM